jgi:transposase
MVRQLSRGGRRKNDRIHAAAAARVAALQGDARPLEAEGPAGASAVLDERRVNLAQPRVRAVNPTPRPAGALLAGGALTDLSANTTAAPLRTVRPTVRLSGAAKRSPETWLPRSAPRKHAWESDARAIARFVAAAGSTLPGTRGVGPIMAGRWSSRPERRSRFTDSSAFANSAGTAPAEIASADKS